MKKDAMIPLLALTAGLGGFIFYMYSIQIFERFIVPEVLLWASLILISASLVYLGGRGSRRDFLLALFLVSVCIGFWFRLRFGDRALFPDLFSEIATAQNVRQFGLTNGLIQNNRFGDALSITILPTVISEVLGVDVMEVFLSLFPILLALIPISIYLAIEKTFRPDVAALASVLFLFDYVNLTLNPFVIRDCFGTLFFLLSLLCLVKAMKNQVRVYSVCFMILAFGAFSSSHTPAYFFVLFVLCLFLSPFASKLFRRLQIMPHEIEHKIALSSSLFVYTIVLGLAWMFFAGHLVLVQLLQQGIIPGLQQLTSGHGSLFGEYLFSFPRGNDLSDLATVAYRICIIAGFVYAIRAEAKNQLSFGLTTWGGVILLLLLLWLFLPGLSEYTVFPDRVYSYGLVMFSVFAALALLKASKIFHYVGKKRFFHAYGKLFVMTIVVLFVLNNVWVMPTMYHSPSSSIPTAQAITTGLFGKTEFSAKQWKQDYVPSNAHLYSDDLPSHVGILVRDIQWKNETNYPINILIFLLNDSHNVPSDSYFLVPAYETSYGYVVYIYFYGSSRHLELPKDAQIKYSVPTFVVVQIDRRVTDSFLAKLNLIYSSGDYSYYASSQ
jgi:uncharacterized membrane protein